MAEINSNKLKVIQPVVDGKSHGERGKLYEASSPLMKTQKIWSDRQALLYKFCFNVIRLTYFGYLPFCILYPAKFEPDTNILVFFGLFCWIWTFLFFGISYHFSWRAIAPLSASGIVDLYKSAGRCTLQKQIIQEAVRQKKTLRYRDLAFVNAIHMENKRLEDEKSEMERLHKVFYDIKNDH